MVAAGLLVRRDGQRTAPVVTTAVLAASAVVAVHLVGVRSFSHEAWPAAAPESDLPLWAMALSGGCLVLGVVAAWLSRVARPGVALGLATATVGAALPAWASWTGVPPTLRSAVLAATALTAAGLAQTVPRWFAGTSRLGRLAWILAAVAVVVHVIAYDPFADLQCTRVCRSTAGPWSGGTRVRDRRRRGGAVGAGGGLRRPGGGGGGPVGAADGPECRGDLTRRRRCGGACRARVARQRGLGSDDVAVDAMGCRTRPRPQCASSLSGRPGSAARSTHYCVSSRAARPVAFTSPSRARVAGWTPRGETSTRTGRPWW